MSGREDPEEEHGCVNRCKHRSVEPSSSLRNEFGHGGGHVGRRLRALDIFEHPCFPLLCDDFEAKDTIFSEVHVPLEKASPIGSTPVHRLSLEVGREGSFTIGPVEESLVTIGTESTG